MRHAIDKCFSTRNGFIFRYRYWPSRSQINDRAILLVHLGEDHTCGLQHFVAELGLDDYSVFTCDLRAQGHSDGELGRDLTFNAYVKDVDGLTRIISRKHDIPVENMVVIAQSAGAFLVAAWAHDYAPRVRGLILLAPKFSSGPDIPRGAIQRVVEDAQAILAPSLVFVSRSFWAVDKKVQHEFFARLGSPIKETSRIDGPYHGSLGEKDRRFVLAKVRNFVTTLFKRTPAVPSLLEADRNGFTREEEIRLSTPPPAFSMDALRFATVRLAMTTLGRLSEGIRLGLKTGFDSGSTLDYVYRNRPGGTTFLGKWLDRSYLNSIGWRGIRARKAHLEQAIAMGATRLRQIGRPVRIVDIAAGHGRYALDAVARLPQPPESILLRDYSDINVRDGTALIEEKKLGCIARFVKADAFDESNIASITPRPTIGIVSGLYELFPENAPVEASLRGLGRAIEERGYLVYTGQPWHPQLELIARTLTSHRSGRPWVMRRRTQAELDQLVHQAGFRKLEQWTDQWGIFTVSLAQRV